MSLSKRRNTLVLVFKNPLKLFYVQLDSKPQLPNSKPIFSISVHEPLL